MNKLIYTFIIINILLLNSCGVIFTKFRNTVYIDSEPQGAEVVFNDSIVCITPAKITFERLDKLDSLKVHLKKDNYFSDKLMLNIDLHSTQQFVDYFPFVLPYLISQSYRGYNGFSQKDYNIKLRNIDSLKNLGLSTKPMYINPLMDKINFGTDFTNITGKYKPNSEFYIEIVPFIGLNGGVITLNLNHYIDIYNLQKTQEDRIDLGLRSGWGYQHINSNFDNHISRGYYILPSISYEIVTSYGYSNKYVISMGPSYINNFYEVGTFIDEPGQNTKLIRNYSQDKGLAFSINAQYFRREYIDRFQYGFSFGYLNKAQYFQFVFGYFIF